MELKEIGKYSTEFGEWIEGTLYLDEGKPIAKYWFKQFDSGSKYGINGGRISKLRVTDLYGNELANYDRGWDIEPRGTADYNGAEMDARDIVQAILNAFN